MWIWDSRTHQYISSTAMNTANIYLNFEDAVKIFKDQKKYTQVLKKVKKFTNYKENYQIKKYRSGTLSLKRKGENYE